MRERLDAQRDFGRRRRVRRPSRLVERRDKLLEPHGQPASALSARRLVFDGPLELQDLLFGLEAMHEAHVRPSTGTFAGSVLGPAGQLAVVLPEASVYVGRDAGVGGACRLVPNNVERPRFLFVLVAVVVALIVAFVCHLGWRLGGVVMGGLYTDKAEKEERKEKEENAKKRPGPRSCPISNNRRTKIYPPLCKTKHATRRPARRHHRRTPH